MKLSTKIIHWSIFLILSALWWFFTPCSYPSPATSLGIKVVVWAFFFSGGIVVTSDDDGWECEWQ